jgi:hypothetical protein
MGQSSFSHVHCVCLANLPQAYICNISLGRSFKHFPYGAESVENAEFARSKRGSNERNGTKSNLPYALGVSLEKMRNGLPQV